jgi:hypothetical protein
MLKSIEISSKMNISFNKKSATNKMRTNISKKWKISLLSALIS